MSSRERARRLKVLGNVGLAVLAVVTAGTIAAVTLTPDAPPPVSDQVASYYSAPPTKAAAKMPVPLTASMKLLDDPQRVWTVGVLGDSTGNATDEWVYLTAEAMSGKYNRPVTIHNWNIDTNTYADATVVGKGAGKPIVIWNGSASGKNMEYSFQHRAVMLPEQPDLVIVNHAHNLGTAQEARTGSYKLVDWVTNAWSAPPAVAVTLQNPRMDKVAHKHTAVVQSLREQWTGAPVTLIDAWKAFKDATPDTAALLRDDSFHPNPAGEGVWAEAVKKALGV